MVTMDSAARAIDALLHRGRAEERDGGVWLDDLAASEVAMSEGMTARDWQWQAEEMEERYEEACKDRDALDERCGEQEEVMQAIAEALDALGPLDDYSGACDSETVDELIDAIATALSHLEPERVKW